MAINKTTQYTTDPNTIPVDTSTGSQESLQDALNNRATDSELSQLRSDTLLEVDLTINIPTDYATIQEAIDGLSTLSVKQGRTVEIIIESGHQPSTGVVVSHGDFSHFKISSVDASVTVDPSWPTGQSFMEATNCGAPVINILVNMNGLGGRGLQYMSASTGLLLAGAGVINATGEGANTAGIYVLSSIVSARNTVFTDNGRGFWITRGSSVDAEGADVSNASTIGFYVSRGSGAEFSSGIAQTCGTVGVVSNRSQVSAPVADCSGCDRGMQAENAGIIAARGATANNCTTSAFRSTDLGTLQARDCSTTGSTEGFTVGTGGLIDRTGSVGTQNLPENNWWRRFGCIIDNGASDYNPPA